MNWDTVRAQYPACLDASYFLTAAVGPLHSQVYKAYQNHIDIMHRQGDVFWADNLENLEETRQLVARSLNTQATQIAFGPNTSNNMNHLALNFKALGFKKIITCKDEFPATILPWEHHGFQIVQLDSENSFIDPDKIIEAAKTNKNSLVAMSGVQFATGFKSNIKYLGKKLKELNIPFVVNATQMYGAFQIDVEQAHVSALTASCHKWVGSGYGTSILYLNKTYKSDKWPFFLGWLGQEEEYIWNNRVQKIRETVSSCETGVFAFASICGLNAALKVINEIGIENISERIIELSDYFVQRVREKEITVLSYRDDLDIQDSANTGTVAIEVKDPEALFEKLQNKKIYTSLRGKGLRLSFHFYNNKRDIDRLVAEL